MTERDERLDDVRAELLTAIAQGVNHGVPDDVLVGAIRDVMARYEIAVKGCWHDMETEIEVMSNQRDWLECNRDAYDRLSSWGLLPSPAQAEAARPIRETGEGLPAELRAEWLLRQLNPDRSWIVEEDGSWSVVIPHMPLHGDGATREEAVQNALHLMREYTDLWEARYSQWPNHEGNGGFVTLVHGSTDAEMRAWLGDVDE